MMFSGSTGVHSRFQIITSKIIFTILATILSLVAHSQEIVGSWSGQLKVQSMQLQLIFHIAKSDNGYTATMDSPDQGARGIAVTSAKFENPQLSLAIALAGIEYKGILRNDTINGTFHQAGNVFPLVLTRAHETKKPLRPQEPAKPYPYATEEVRFENKTDGVTLVGTFTWPSTGSSFPAVVLISGSGPQNRDEELMDHRPFLVLADHLTRNGIAVLRFDDRGVGASSGDFRTATSADFANDAEAAVKYLKTRKEVNPKYIGLAGHSEGGLIAPMVAARSKDVAFIVLLAGPGIPGDQIMLLQQRLIAQASGVDSVSIALSASLNRAAFDMVKKSSDTEQLKKDLAAYFQQNNIPATYASSAIAQLTNPWMQYFVTYDPRPALEKVKCPVLALNGARDLQVPAKENLEAIQQALTNGGNRRVTTLTLPGLNHLFQPSTTGLPSEYGQIEETFSPEALKEIVQWITKVNH